MPSSSDLCPSANFCSFGGVSKIILFAAVLPCLTVVFGLLFFVDFDWWAFFFGVALAFRLDRLGVAGEAMITMLMEK